MFSSHSFGGYAFAVVLALTTLSLNSSVAYSHDLPDGEDDDEHAEHAAAHPSRHAALFVGATNHAGHRLFTIGAEVTHRLPFGGDRLSAGALLDASFDHGDHTLIAGAGLFLRPFKGSALTSFKVLAAPALEVHNGHHTPLVRVGAGYDLHHGPLTLTPTFNVDFVDGHSVEVFGVAAGISF